MAATLKKARQDAKACRDCPLWANATQTVFGAGDPHARVMLVGEQPGDEEDKKGLPFVGPAGRLLDRALEAAGVDREHLYVTNTVKHFKWEPRGKRRLHKTPAQREIDACHQWIEREIALVKPHVIVALGSTAAKALIGAKKSLAHLKLLDVERNRIGAVTAKKLAAALPNARTGNQRKEAQPELFRRYVSTME